MFFHFVILSIFTPLAFYVQKYREKEGRIVVLVNRTNQYEIQIHSDKGGLEGGPQGKGKCVSKYHEFIYKCDQKLSVAAKGK